jgi:uncharacterized metal-binding protein
MADECCTQNQNIMLLSCSGGSNVGQLANRASVELTQEGYGKIFCLAGIGGHLSGFIQSAKDVPVMVAIDGCPVGCAKKTLEHAQVPLKHYLIVTEEGIEKNGNFNLDKRDVDRVKAAIKRVAGNGGAALPGTGSSCCGCSAC